MKQPVVEIVRRIWSVPLHHKIAHVRVLIQIEKPRSVRRQELELLLKGFVAKQLKREARAA